MTPQLRTPIVVVGSINADLVARVARAPQPGETVLGHSFAITPGGKGANQAVAAALLGGRVAMVGAVGDDAFAEPALAGLRASGVDLAAVDRVAGSTGVALIQVDDDGENSIVVVPGANAAVTPQLVAERGELIAGADVVIVQGEIPADSVAATIKAAIGRMVLNLAPVIALDPNLLRRADPLVVNELEGYGALDILTAQLPPNAPALPNAPAPPKATAPPTATAAAAAPNPFAERIEYQRDVANGPGNQYARQVGIARELLRLGVPSVIITIGAAGALVGENGEVSAVPAPRVKAVDTTGAGDAFVGALASRLAAGDSLDDAARFAVRVGAFAVTRPGAQPSYPTPADHLPQ